MKNYKKAAFIFGKAAFLLRKCDEGFTLKLLPGDLSPDPFFRIGFVGLPFIAFEAANEKL